MMNATMSFVCNAASKVTETILHMKWTYGSTEIILQDKVPESVLIQYLYRSCIHFPDAVLG
jgi:hypothetical protein